MHYSDGCHDWRHGFDAGDPRIATRNTRHSAVAGSLDPDAPLTFLDYADGRDPVMAVIASLLGAPAG